MVTTMYRNHQKNTSQFFLVIDSTNCFWLMRIVLQINLRRGFVECLSMNGTTLSNTVRRFFLTQSWIWQSTKSRGQLLLTDHFKWTKLASLQWLLICTDNSLREVFVQKLVTTKDGEFLLHALTKLALAQSSNSILSLIILSELFYVACTSLWNFDRYLICYAIFMTPVSV
jgi:hypothetical protein